MLLGDVVAWRVIQLPASGQISNVSAFVIPERAGMPDDGQVHPGDMGAEPWRPFEIDKFLELERVMLSREQEKTDRQRLKLERARFKATRKQSPKAPKQLRDTRERHAYRPQDKALRVYKTCRAQFVEWEQAVRQLELPVTQKTIFTAAAGPHPKTQDNIMTLHGLSYPRDWPPSTWPAHSPKDPPGQI